MNNKLQVWIATIASSVILTVTGVVFYQMYNNHHVNEQIIEDCFKYFDREDVVIVKDSFWSTARCVNEES